MTRGGIDSLVKNLVALRGRICTPWERPASDQRMGLPKRITLPSGSEMEPSRLP